MKDLLEAIREKREAIARLQRDLQVLEKAASLLGGDAGPSEVSALDSSRSRKARRTRRAGPFNKKSATGQAVGVLAEAQMPLHLDEIVTRIQQRGGKVKKSSLVASLSRMVKRNRVFVRTGPNTFGLLKWKAEGGGTGGVAAG